MLFFASLSNNEPETLVGVLCRYSILADMFLSSDSSIPPPMLQSMLPAERLTKLRSQSRRH
jgi:hypothetical protein